MSGVNYDEQVEIISMLDKEYNPIAIKIDASGPGGQTMEDILSQEKYCGYKIQGFDLTAMFKENIIIRLRMLMQRRKLDLPSKDMGTIADKLELQLHGIQRTSTKLGLHTRYSGKEVAGMDDMAWALALSVYKEFTFEFEPMIICKKDSVLEKLQQQADRDESGGALAW
jgi:hypothetical protein